MTNKWLILGVLAAVAAWGAAGCSGDSSSDTGDVAADGGADADADADADGADADADADADGADADADADADVATDDGGGGGGTCADPIALSCGATLTGQDNTTAASTLVGYGCDMYGADETGGEVVYALTGTASNHVTVTMTPSGSWDLDLYLLPASCSPADSTICSVGVSAETVTFNTDMGATYYLVVDGYSGAAGPFDIAVTCDVGEICDNGIDDNGNGVIDCADAQCWTAAACAENCTNGLDDDFNGLIDCADLAACSADPACLESNCSNTTDDDGDTLVDCADNDCIGAAACATGGGTAGQPCLANSDCASGACADETHWGWPGGYCLGHYVASGGDCTTMTCDAGSTCACFTSGPCACFSSCTAAGDCRGGYDCIDITGDGVGDLCGGGNCTADAQCTVTGHCDVAGGFCQVPPEDCTNTVDDDGDTLVDCADSDCLFVADCGATGTSLDGGATCDAAVAITMPADERGTVVVTGSLATAAGDEHTPSCAPVAMPDVVYTFTLTATAHVTVDALGGSGAGELPVPVVALARACSEPDFQCNAMYGGVEAHARVAGVLGAGTYDVYVDGAAYDATGGGYVAGTGTYTLGFDFADP